MSNGAVNFLGRLSQDSCLKVFWVYMQEQHHWPIVIHIFSFSAWWQIAFCSSCNNMQSQQQHRVSLPAHLHLHQVLPKSNLLLYHCY